MASVFMKSSSGLHMFAKPTSSCCVLFTILLGTSRVSSAAVQHHVEGRDATHDATHLASTDHAALSLIRREAEAQKIHNSAAESDRAKIIDGRAPIQASNRGAWWFWPEPEPLPAPAPAPATEPALAPFPFPAKVAAPVIDKQKPRHPQPEWKPFVDNRHFDEIATVAETAFFESLEAEIKAAWFIHGQSVIIMIAKRPYLVSPSSYTPIKRPHALEEELGLGIDISNPEAVARKAYAKNVAELVMWVPDVEALKTLVRDFTIETMANLQTGRLLRGFWKGEEHSTRHLDKMKSSDFVTLGLNTMWLRGGLGRENLMQKAMRSTLMH